MSQRRNLIGGYLAGLLIVVAFCSSRATLVLAQDEGAGGAVTIEDGQAPEKLPVRFQTLYAICHRLENTAMGKSIRDSLWLFPAIETVHIFGIISLVGSTSILDLRLMGVAFKQEPVSKLARSFLPWTWAGFLIQVTSGILLFSSEATKMYDNRAFQVKMLLIVMAGVNATVFHFLAYKSVGKWETDPVAPFSARFAGTFSILLWFGIVAAGRWIAYV